MKSPSFKQGFDPWRASVVVSMAGLNLFKQRGELLAIQLASDDLANSLAGFAAAVVGVVGVQDGPDL